MSGDRQQPRKIRLALGEVLKRLDPEHRLRAFEVWNFWDEAVGETLARRAQPTAFRNGVLIVTVSTHVWLQELQFLKDALRDGLNARLGEPLIRDISFVSGSVEQRPPTVKLTQERAPTREITLPAIDDPDLAAAFERVVRAHVRRVPAARRRR